MSSRTARRSHAAAVLLLTTMAGGACGEQPPVPPQAVQSALVPDFTRGPRRAPANSPAFDREFRQLHRTVTALPAGGAPVRLTYCTADGDGTVYYAGRDSRDLYAWRPGEPGVRTLPIAAADRPVTIAALSWSPEQNALYVLDAGHNRVMKYDREGRLLDYVFLNAGQGGLTLHALPGRRFLVGGERWVKEGSATLAAVYDESGRLAASFFPMDSAAHADNMDVYIPVLNTPFAPGELLIAEPTSYRITRTSLSGEVLQRFGEAPEGYRPPRPLPDRSRPQDEMDLWRQSWTPLLFLHAAEDRVFAAFQVHRPRRGYQFEVYGRDGARRSGSLVTGRRPACAHGRRVFFVEPVSSDSVELSVYEHAGA